MKARIDIYDRTSIRIDMPSLSRVLGSNEGYAVLSNAIRRAGKDENVMMPDTIEAQGSKDKRAETDIK